MRDLTLCRDPGHRSDRFAEIYGTMTAPAGRPPCAPRAGVPAWCALCAAVRSSFLMALSLYRGPPCVDFQVFSTRTLNRWNIFSSSSTEVFLNASLFKIFVRRRMSPSIGGNGGTPFSKKQFSHMFFLFTDGRRFVMTLESTIWIFDLQTGAT